MFTRENLKAFVIECLFFTKPFAGSIIPNFLLAIFAWLNIGVIVLMLIALFS